MRHIPYLLALLVTAVPTSPLQSQQYIRSGGPRWVFFSGLSIEKTGGSLDDASSIRVNLFEVQTSPSVALNRLVIGATLFEFQKGNTWQSDTEVISLIPVTAGLVLFSRERIIRYPEYRDTAPRGVPGRRTRTRTFTGRTLERGLISPLVTLEAHGSPWGRLGDYLDLYLRIRYTLTLFGGFEPWSFFTIEARGGYLAREHAAWSYVSDPANLDRAYTSGGHTYFSLGLSFSAAPGSGPRASGGSVTR